MSALDNRADAILRRLDFPNPKIAEIGVARGMLSAKLLNRSDLHLTMVDSWAPTEDQPERYKETGDSLAFLSADDAALIKDEAHRRTEFASDRRHIIHATSLSAAESVPDHSLDLVFIDADHTREAVAEDLRAWYSKVRPGGWICGHDYMQPNFPGFGVGYAVHEFVDELRLTVELDADYTWHIQVPGPTRGWRDPHHDELTVACVMVGDYEGRGAEYVHILKDMVTRNLRDVPFRFVCITDITIPGVECWPIFEATKGYKLTGWWAKLAMFELLRDQRVLYFDLDTAIVGPLEPLVESLAGVPFAAIADPNLQAMICSAVMYWEGDHSDIYLDWLDSGSPKEFPVSIGDQAWIYSRRPDCDRIQVLAPDLLKSYKLDKLSEGVPEECSVVYFHGKPRPHTLKNWVADIWKVGGFARPRWFTVLNNSDERILTNVKINQARDDVPYIAEQPGGTQAPVALCCGGPTLNDHIEHIKALKEAGAEVWAVNAVADHLAEHGIIADVHVILDSLPHNVRFVQDSRPETKYYIATQADPAVFDSLLAAGRNVSRWDAVHPGVESAHLRICGGATVGLKGLCLAVVAGHRVFHVFGMDGSFKQGKAHHAYPQPENDQQLTLEVMAAGRKFFCPRWGAKQASDAMALLPLLLDAGCELDFYGDGLIQWCIKNMVKTEEVKGE